MYLTGDENGNPVVYPKMFEYIESLAAMYFSPMGLKYMIKFHGGGNPTQQVMGRQAAAEMHELMGAGGVFNCIKEAVKWSLVKGKAFVKLNWKMDDLRRIWCSPSLWASCVLIYAICIANPLSFIPRIIRQASFTILFAICRIWAKL